MNAGHDPRNHVGKYVRPFLYFWPKPLIQTEAVFGEYILLKPPDNKKIDWSKVKTIKDIKIALSALAEWYVLDDGSDKFADARKLYADE